MKHSILSPPKQILLCYCKIVKGHCFEISQILTSFCLVLREYKAYQDIIITSFHFRREKNKDEEDDKLHTKIKRASKV